MKPYSEKLVFIVFIKKLTNKLLNIEKNPKLLKMYSYLTHHFSFFHVHLVLEEHTVPKHLAYWDHTMLF